LKYEPPLAPVYFNEKRWENRRFYQFGAGFPGLIFLSAHVCFSTGSQRPEYQEFSSFASCDLPELNFSVYPSCQKKEMWE
ncbi:hypothetical protein, partial [Marinilabilia sp.]|uniref:hypothetical protein n=1 Tax=Marinilabilia sp. TaxID=2021252 RepID=UPI0025BC4B45